MASPSRFFSFPNCIWEHFLFFEKFHFAPMPHPGWIPLQADCGRSRLLTYYLMAS
jgi:hypothetical protein